MFSTIRMASVVPMVLLLASCAMTPTLPEALTIANESVTSVATVTGQAYQEGRMTKLQACRVLQFSKVAASLVDEGWEHWVENDPETAAQKLRAAREALQGVSQAGLEAASQECGDE